MSLTKRLEQVLESAEYASSEVYSARESLPDYNTNEKGNEGDISNKTNRHNDEHRYYNT